MDKSGDNRDDLAKYLNIAYQTLSKKLNGHTNFTLTEMKKIKKRYSLCADEIDIIFFRDDEDEDVQ